MDGLAGVTSRVPQRFDGTSSTGGVRVTIGADGLPIAFEVDQDWKRYLRPDAFGAAVVQAARAAEQQRLIAFAQAYNGGGEPLPAGPITQVTQKPDDVNKIAQAVVALMANFDALIAAPPVEGSGAAGFGKVMLTLTTDQLVSCTADQFWVSDRSGEELTTALTAALAAAREDLATKSAQSPLGQVDRLLDASVASLRSTSL